MSITERSDKSQAWFAIRVTYSREMLVKSYLDGIGIENYIPMHTAERTYNGTSRKVWEPLVHNLIFVRTSAGELKRIKSESALPIRYIMNRETNTPTVIPEREMQDFIAVVATLNEHVEIVPPEAVDLSSGDRVRITDGPFKGIMGVYIRHKGHSKVAVAIRDIATALTAYVPAKFIEKLMTE